MARQTRKFSNVLLAVVFLAALIAGISLWKTRGPQKELTLTKENLPDGVVQVLGGRPEKPLNLPLDVAVAPDGRIFVADAGNNAVQTFYPWGQPRGLFGKGKIDFVYPNTVAIDQDGQLYVGEFNAGRIRVFGPKGKLKLTINRQTAGVPVQPLDLAVGSDGRIYVADRQGAVLILAKNGRLLRQINLVPADPQALSFPNGIAVDTDGRFLVADSGNRRLLLFAPNGKLLRVIQSDILTHPRGCAFWGENYIVVADPFAGQLVVLNYNGRIIKNLNAESEPGLAGIVLNGLTVYEDRIYATDRVHNVVLVFGRRQG